MNGTTALRRSVGGGGGSVAGQGGGGVAEPAPVATLVVYKDDAGYGMKVSGDNPVFVQSVKEGGAAERAGLHAGDKIIKEYDGGSRGHSSEFILIVNGVNVMQSTHIEVVGLIKSSTQVVLTVQQKPVVSPLSVGLTGQQHHRPVSLSAASIATSPSQHATSLHRASTAPAGGAPCNTRITGPQPVDHEKKLLVDTVRVHTVQLMLEKEQNYVDKLRSELAKAGTGSGNMNNIATLQTELAGAERRVRTLQEKLATITTNDQLCSLVTNTSSPTSHYLPSSSSSGSSDVPPPLPSRKSLSMQSLSPPPLPPRPPATSNTHNTAQSELERHLLTTHLTPPTTSYGIPNSFSQGANLGSSASFNKHQRTKSSPEQLGTNAISPGEASKRLIAFESMNDLSPARSVRQHNVTTTGLEDSPHLTTPPGTPPPPYPAPSLNDLSSPLNDSVPEGYVTASPPSRQSTLNESSPGMPPIQQSIISMEDDDMSDQEVGQLEDHGPFKSLSRLWEHHAHLAVFINYVLSNSDPSSLLFYLITDLYKEGNAKEMRKWAYEIHSSFLVPGAPLRLNNVDENVAREIDEHILKESDKEEILRKIFWKARQRAKEELNEQLTDFQQKRTAGLGTLFGPSDALLDASISDKTREVKIIETYLLPLVCNLMDNIEPSPEEIEKEHIDLRRFTIAAGLATVLAKIFQVRPMTTVPTFVAKDKSNIKAKLTGKTRKMNLRGHHFIAHQYYTVTFCNHCQLIIGGIGPQGYQCSDCSLNVHRQCVRVVEEYCPGPVVRKEKGNDRISKLMERIRPERKPPSSHHHHHPHNRQHVHDIKRDEEESPCLTDGENGIGPLTLTDKVGRECKVAKKAKSKSAKVRSPRVTKASIASKVWDTLSAVRKGRGPSYIVESALIQLDQIANSPSYCLDADSQLAGYDAGALRNSRPVFSEEEDNLAGEHRGGGATGNTRGIGERGRVSAYGGGSDHADSMDDPSSREDISEMVQQNISSKPKTSNINRSESYKERIHHKRQIRDKRKTSDPNLSKTKAGFSDCDATTGVFPGNSAGSSSNSSLSTRSLDSPSTSLEQVHPATAASTTAASATASTAATSSPSWDSDVDVEPDPPDWSQGVAEDVLARLSNSEKKRQEVINELFHTERSHVRALKVLSQVFHKPLLESQLLPLDQIELLFANLDEMVTIHSNFNQAMKRKKKENPCVGDVGELLLDMFDGEAGEAFEIAASNYCAKQQVALEALRDRRRKDPKLNTFLNDIEANPLCRRLQLKDHILTGMLRLTKYPLLFEKLAKYTPENNEKERNAVLRSLERSKEILSRVNQAVRDAEDYLRLAEIQRTIVRLANDKCDHPTVKEFRNIDITKRKLIYEGPLQWRVEKRAKLVDLHVVLLDDTIFLLQRQDEKYVLKFINTNQVNSILSPIIKVSTVLVRTNAVDHNSLFLVNTSEKGAQIYDLVATSPAEKEIWLKHISEVAAPYQAQNQKTSSSRLHPPGTNVASTTTTASPISPLPAPQQPLEQSSQASTEQTSTQHKDHSVDDSTITEQDEEEEEEEDEEEEEEEEREEDGEEEEEEEETRLPGTTESAETQQQQSPKPTESPAAGTGEPLRLVTCTTCSLIDPLDIDIEERPVYVAERVLTPIGKYSGTSPMLECLRRKDEVIKQALSEKQSLVADILNIPREEVERVTDATVEAPGIEKEPSELILAAISQVDQFTGMLNSALEVNETDSILASRGMSATACTSCEASGCPAHRVHPHPRQPVLPVASLQPICQSLLSQLSQLLEIVKEREEERERLRKELRRSRERLHAIDADAQRQNSAVVATQTYAESGEQLHSEKKNVDETSLEQDFIAVPTKSEAEAEIAQVEALTEVMGDSVG